ncbi:Oligosaccharyl transferase STT3 subunit family, partial [mine drainage metagenome]
HLGATMLAWQGYTYVVAVVVIFLAVVLVVERIRGLDSFGLYVVTLIVGTVGFLMAMPYYYLQGDFGYWFTVPVFLWFGGLLVLLPFLFLRNAPWVVSVPALFLSVLAAAGGLYLYNPAYFSAVLTGQGYFIKSLIYSTVAEAQAPSFDALIVSYGVLTFFLAFAGFALFLYYLYAHRFRREHVFMVIFSLLGIYLPVSAAKFFLLGSPVFALLPAEVVLVGIDRLGLPQMRRNFASRRGPGEPLARPPPLGEAPSRGGGPHPDRAPAPERLVCHGRGHPLQHEGPVQPAGLQLPAAGAEGLSRECHLRLLRRRGDPGGHSHPV